MIAASIAALVRPAIESPQSDEAGERHDVEQDFHPGWHLRDPHSPRRNPADILATPTGPDALFALERRMNVVGPISFRALRKFHAITTRELAQLSPAPVRLLLSASVRRISYEEDTGSFGDCGGRRRRRGERPGAG
jgi:hypothetical protein